MRYTKIWFALLALSLVASSSISAQDPGWPRKLVKPGGTVIIYQPQVDDWNNFTDIKWRQLCSARFKSAFEMNNIQRGDVTL
jgi:hypothetical protein